MQKIYITIALLGLLGICLLLFIGLKQQTHTAPLPVLSPKEDVVGEPIEEKPIVPLEEKIGALFMVGHWAHAPIASTTALLEKYHIGGVIIMSAPEDTGEIAQWTAQWQKIASGTLLVATDQEGGVVQRITGLGYSTTSQRELTDEDHAYNVAKKRGEGLRVLGIDMNFAPVLDSATNKDSFMYKRTFKNASTSHYFADAMIHGFEDAGVIAIPKHFPGHDDTQDDSHFTLPKVAIQKSNLDTFTQPFRKLLEAHPPKGLMTAHVLFPSIDTKPATLSSFFLTDYLRNALHFEGVIITDDMTMDAIDTVYTTRDATVLALEAGADLILFAAAPEQVQSAIATVIEAIKTGRLSEEHIHQSYARVEQLHATPTR